MLTQSDKKKRGTNPGRLLESVYAALLVVALFGAATLPAAFAQTASTGALAGTITDPSGAVVPGAEVKVVNLQTGETRTTRTGASGAYTVPLLPPGAYRFAAAKPGFRTATDKAVTINVTETAHLSVQLQVGGAGETVEVRAVAPALQTESSALGHVTGGTLVANLPLVTRNYTQIIALNPGVAADVTNADDVGRGGGGTDETPVVAHGVSTQDNNYQMNGVEIDDLQSSGHFSGGIAIPNPDAIQEFKVQTGQYDASYGRDAGANVDVVTKSGGNDFHGTVFEYFRNEALNANDFFRDRARRAAGDRTHLRPQRRLQRLQHQLPGAGAPGRRVAQTWYCAMSTAGEIRRHPNRREVCAAKRMIPTMGY